MTQDEMRLKQVGYHLMMARASAISLTDPAQKEAILFKIDTAQDFLEKLLSNATQ